MRGSSLKLPTNGLTVRTRPFRIVPGAGRVGETVDLFQSWEPNPCSLLAARPAYKTSWGAMYGGDASALLATLPDRSLDLV